MFLNKEPKRGIAMYFDKGLNAQPCHDFDNDFEEQLWCTFKGGNEELVLVGCIYRSPNSNDNNNNELFKLLRAEQMSKYDKILIFGDFNFPDVKWDGTWNSGKNNDIVENLRDAFLIQKVTRPTRVREGQRPTIDDLVLVNEEFLISDIEYHDHLGKSDHLILTFELYVPRAKTTEGHKYKFNLQKGDYNKMRKMFSEQINSLFHDEQDVEEMWNILKCKIVESMEECIPKTKCGKGIICKPLWMNDKVLKKIKKKYNLFKRYLLTKDGKDYIRYAKIRNKSKSEIKSARKAYERKIAEECKKDPKCFWKYVQERTKVNAGVNTLNNGKGGLAESDMEKAEVLNEFFASVFAKENTNNIPDISQCSKSNGISVIDIIITPAAVEKKLHDLNQFKAQGPDSIPPKVLKELSKELAVPLSMIFNKSLETGKVPFDWKLADVTAIFKKGSKAEPGNYRPVSLTCIACKVLESIIRDVIISHFNDNDLFAVCQHGFRSKRSCMSQLLEVMEDLVTMIENKFPIDIIYLDFRKAFDTVPHERLLKKMEAYGIVGKLLNWVRDFLSNRKQRVRVGNCMSSEKDVKSGIPQGSILGPVLFTIFINDLPDEVTSFCKIFADDTKIYDKSDNHKTLQDNLYCLQKWSERWNLYFNVDKCKVLHVGKNNPEHEYNMKINEEYRLIHKCEEEKDLGVIFDKDLLFDAHIQKSINKANQMVGLIKRTFLFLNKEIFLKLYKAMVRPHLEYGNIIWYPHFKRQSVSIERVQRRATKLLQECYNMSYEDRLGYLNLHSLKGRRTRGDLIEAFKIFHQLTDLQWDYFFEDAKSDKTRNPEGKVFINQFHTNMGKSMFSNRVATNWNNLSYALKFANSTNAFKNLLDQDPKFKVEFRSFDE